METWLLIVVWWRNSNSSKISRFTNNVKFKSILNASDKEIQRYQILFHISVLSIDCCLAIYFLPNFASKYQKFIEIKDHSNVYFIHLPPRIEGMANLYSSYFKKTHLYIFLVSNCALKWGIEWDLTCDVDLNPLS